MQKFEFLYLKLVPAKGNLSSLWVLYCNLAPTPLFRCGPSLSPPPLLTPHFLPKFSKKEDFQRNLLCAKSQARGSTWFLLRRDIMMGIVL